MSEPDPVFTPAAVQQITAHMNADHAEDNALICRALGGVPAATAARLSAVDADAFHFVATVHGAPVSVRVPFRARLTERRQVRSEAVRMYAEACAALGVEPRR